MAKIFNALILSVLLHAARCSDSNVCKQKSPCVCEFSEFSKIDISQATQKGEEPLKPQDFLQDEANGDVFYFHGCEDGLFNATAPGSNTSTLLHGSLIRQSRGNYSVLGNASQINFNVVLGDKGAYELVYKGPNGAAIARIHLVCDNFNQPFIKVLANTSSEQVLALSSPHACIATRHPGLSTGSVLVIMFFISVSVYFVCGGLILYFMRGARGLEVIPNIDFWRGLPGLVKDGLIFLFSGCNSNSITTPETYDRI